MTLSNACANGKSVILLNRNGLFSSDRSLTLKFTGNITVTRLGEDLTMNVQSLMDALDDVDKDSALESTINSFTGQFTLVNRPLIIDDFESGTIPVAHISNSTEYLWRQYPVRPNVLIDIVNEACLDFLYCLRARLPSGDLGLQYYPHDGFSWQYMRERLADEWDFNTYNRIRFFVKLPTEYESPPTGQHNIEIEASVRASNRPRGTPNEGGTTLSHYYNIPPSGIWHEVIWDTHPNFILGVTGGTELPNMPYPTGESNFNYFDALTTFRILMTGFKQYPAEVKFDRFELYHEVHDENVEQVYSLHGAFNKTTNTLYVGWMRNKNENNVIHDVRYAFESIYKIGWDNAIPAPNGAITPPGYQGYNGMNYSTNAINMEGHLLVYVAIKPRNSTRFRQIAIPLR